MPERKRGRVIKKKICRKCKRGFKPNSNSQLKCKKCSPWPSPPPRPAKDSLEKALDEMDFQRSKLKGFLSG